MPPYEPDVIERFAARLERRAVAVRRGSIVGGAVLGGLFGSVPLTPLSSAWPVPAIFGFATLLVGLCVGALIGYVIGDGRAEIYRLHAQTTLCQLHAQRTSLAIWRHLQLHDEHSKPVPVEPEHVVAFEPRSEPAAELLAAPEPLPQSEPEPEPRPVFVPEPVREAMRLTSVPAPPSPLRPAGVPAPPLSPPPLTG